MDLSEEIEVVEVVEPVVVADAPEVEPEAPRDNGDAIDRALEKLGQPRGPDGKFAPKEPAAEVEAPEAPVDAQPVEPAPISVPDAPARLSPAAKAEWAKAPDALRADVIRGYTELEAGIAKYRETVEPFRPFLDRAQRAGQDPHAVLQSYVGIEDMLRQNPVAGLEQICTNMGTSLRDIAAKVLGQPAPEKDALIDGLRQELTALKQQVGGVTQTFQQQKQAETIKMVEGFWQAHPRADELSNDALDVNIPDLIKRGYALDKAYEIADRFNPAPAAAVIPPPAADVPQTRKADLSISGSPGSNPAVGRAKSNGEALDRAIARVSGLGLS